MNPRSTVIEIFPGRFFEPVLSNVGDLAGILWHVAIDRNDRVVDVATLPETCHKYTAWENCVDAICRHDLFHNVEIDVRLLDAYPRLATFRIQRVKRPVAQTGDKTIKCTSKKPREITAVSKELFAPAP